MKKVDGTYFYYYLLRINGMKKLDATFSAPIFGMVQKICNKYYGVFFEKFRGNNELHLDSDFVSELHNC